MAYKKLLGFFLFLLIPSLVYCQNSYWGIRAGATFNKVNGIELKNSMYVGYTGGVFANFYINDRLSFQHELCYAVRGLNGELTNGKSYKVGLSYIDVPWVINYHFGPALFIQTGVQASVYTFLKSPRYDSVPYNKYNANVLDFSILFGAGVILNNNMIVGVRINQSVSKTFNISSAGGNILNMQVYIAYAINRSTSRGLRTSYGGHGNGR